MNYFNYFTEIETRFQQRRGSILMLSTLDWALIETWREAGVPLEAVLRGIDDAFNNRDKQRARLARSTASLGATKLSSNPSSNPAKPPSAPRPLQHPNPANPALRPAASPATSRATPPCWTPPPPNWPRRPPTPPPKLPPAFARSPHLCCHSVAQRRNLLLL
jgi:hypothetical protein